MLDLIQTSRLMHYDKQVIPIAFSSLYPNKLGLTINSMLSRHQYVIDLGISVNWGFSSLSFDIIYPEIPTECVKISTYLRTQILNTRTGLLRQRLETPVWLIVVLFMCYTSSLLYV